MKALAAVLLALLSGCATTDTEALAAFLGGVGEGMNRSSSRTCLVTPMGRGIYNADCD